MPLPPDEHSPEWYALWSSIALTIVGVVWKFVFGARQDLRSDQKNGVVGNAYADTIRMLQQELKDERALRKTAEAEARALRKIIMSVSGGVREPPSEEL